MATRQIELMQRFAWLFAPSAQGIGFAIRLCICMASALWLAMWLQLDRPYWASLEVAVMIQPVPGAAVARGAARAGGVIVAGCAGLLIAALFEQSYELSAAALACWVALCAFGANLMRNNVSYGFAIAGFIAGITVVLTHSVDETPFEIAIARMQECLLAAVCVMVINVLLSPPTSVRTYYSSRLDLLRGLAQEFARLARIRAPDEAASVESPDEDDPHAVLQGLVGQALELEQARQYVSYESPGFANFSRMARRLDYDIVALISATSSLHLYLSRQTGRVGRPGDVDLRPLAALVEPARRLADAPEDARSARTAFDAAHEQIIGIARDTSVTRRDRHMADWVVISRALDIVSRGRAAVVKHGLLMVEREHPHDKSERRSEFGQPMDFKHAARNSLRTLVAVGLGGAVWANFHDQLPAVLLVILLSALTTIFSTVPDPVAAGGGFVKGLGVAAVYAFVVDFLILPQANSYAMLMLAMLPFIFLAGLGMINPSTALPARISAVMFSLLVHTQNGSLPDFTVYFQIVIGIAGAVSLSVLAFKLVLPVTPRQRLREQMAGVFGELAAGSRYSRERFETRMYDRLNGLALTEIDEPIHFSAQQAVLAAVNIGLEARGLVVMSERGAFSDDIRNTIQSEMQRLGRVFAGRQPALATLIEIQNATHELARRMLTEAVPIEDLASRRIAIRACVSAELVAAALADYALAFEVTERDQLKLGEVEPSQT